MAGDRNDTRPAGNQEEKSMPCTISQEPVNEDMKEIFEDVFPRIPKVVRNVCVNIGHDPDRMDVDEFAQRIGVLLWKNDYRVLRSFKHESSLETWLFTIAKRRILRWLPEQDRIDSLEDKAFGYRG
jgi:DNA-directed RNA polymerase specialized sigma24 family protein